MDRPVFFFSIAALTLPDEDKYRKRPFVPSSHRELTWKQYGTFHPEADRLGNFPALLHLPEPVEWPLSHGLSSGG